MSNPFTRRHFNASLFGLSVWGCCLPPASAATAPLVLVLGDSLSAEYGLRRGSGWVAQLEQRLAQLPGPRPQVVNASISGDTSAGGLSRLPGLLQRHRPSVLVIELGANDALRGLPLDNTRHNLQAMAQLARAARARVLLLGMQIPPNYGQRHAETFRRLFVEVAQREKTGLVPFFLAGVADQADRARWFQADQLHPNEHAQTQMLDNVWPELKPLLKP